MALRNLLYRLARLLGDTRAVTSGDPKRVGRRAKNRLLGRAIFGSRFWRRLWR